MKNNLPGLYIGRFQPFHLGHLDALRQIFAREKKVIICVGSSEDFDTPENPYMFRERYEMIRGVFSEAKLEKKLVGIFAVRDIHDDQRWVAHVERLLPTFGTVYTGYELVARLFRREKKHPVIILKKQLPISATEVRKKMKQGEDWQRLVPQSIYKYLATHEH